MGVLMRRTHKKSRYGCRECKQRHIKCDESRPSCVNCSTVQRRCSFLTTAAALPSPSQLEPPEQRLRIDTPVSTSGSSPAQPSVDVPEHSEQTLDQYSIVHLKLLHHFEHELSRAMLSLHPGMGPLLHLVVQEAFATPFLMDQLLGLSAAHRSTTFPEDNQATYHIEATRLQTRSLRGFNAEVAKDGAGNKPLAVFIFSTLVSHHALFQACRTQGRCFASLLDEFDTCFKLHRGVGAVAGQALPNIDEHIRTQILVRPRQNDAAAGSPSVMTERGDECADLFRLVEASNLSQSTREIYREAIDTLQDKFDLVRSSPQTRVAAAQEWLVLAPTAYQPLLYQRHPEALVIFAHYAVLLHRARDYWAVGDAGSFLVSSIRAHLGPGWAEWLKWPVQVVGDSVG